MVDVTYDRATLQYKRVSDGSVITPTAQSEETKETKIYSYQVFYNEKDTKYYYDYNLTFQVPDQYSTFIDTTNEYTLFSQTQFDLESNVKTYSFQIVVLKTALFQRN